MEQSSRLPPALPAGPSLQPLGSAHILSSQPGPLLRSGSQPVLSLAPLSFLPYRTIGDRMGEAKASGNLGNTLKVLGRFDEATVCCQRHLDIAREQGDKVGHQPQTTCPPTSDV